MAEIVMRISRERVVEAIGAVWDEATYAADLDEGRMWAAREWETRGDALDQAAAVQRCVEALGLAEGGIVELVRELRSWAETYEDHMDSSAFDRRAATLAKADAFIQASS